jgi:Ca2+-binding EF-hand superfamily protein
MTRYRALAAATLLAAFVAPSALANQNGGAVGQDRRDPESRDRQAQMRFRGMDKDGDGVITRAEWRGSTESFRLHDINHDGVLSGDEVRTIVEESRFAVDDQDRDGVITRSEWHGTPESFRWHDTNNDGVLSGAEVKSLLAETQEPVGDEADARRQNELANRFNSADHNGDERISRDEWEGTTQAFRKLDRNADGIISREEFMAAAVDRPGTPARQRETRAYQAGYDKGLAEGRQAGKEDKTVNGGRWDLEGQRELEQADSGFDARLGSREDYQTGYRAGFRIGYREGFGPR